MLLFGWMCSSLKDVILYTTQYFVGKPEGDQQCIFYLFLTIFFVGSTQTWGLRGTRRGDVKSLNPRQIESTDTTAKDTFHIN